MWSLKRPTLSAQSAFTTSISRVRNAALAARLASATPAIVEASAQFDDAARVHRLHEFPAHHEVEPDITVGEMEKVYTQRMAKGGAPGRDIYDEIFASAPSGRCPLCMQRFVATLDHHLPKAHYPALAVAPLNLIPACSDCNKAKLAARPITADDVPLHPYYDDLGDEVWLTATVVESRPSALRFEIARSVAWDDTLFARVNRHFRSLGLAALFASEAAEELLHIRHQLEIMRDTLQADGVRDELERRSRSCAAARVNGWRSAAYTAWSKSGWFCDGGFLPNH
jgi:hypothetical protein